MLCRLRLVRTRGAAQRLVDEGRLRINRQRITKHAAPVSAGDVLTLALHGEVRVIEILSIPPRRGPPAEARAHYAVLDENAKRSQEAILR